MSSRFFRRPYTGASKMGHRGREPPANGGIIGSDLLLYYNVNISASYPGSGSTWFDISGNGRDATLTNVVFQDGSLFWNGTTAYANATLPSYFTYIQDNGPGITIFLARYSLDTSNRPLYYWGSRIGDSPQGVNSSQGNQNQRIFVSQSNVSTAEAVNGINALTTAIDCGVWRPGAALPSDNTVSIFRNGILRQTVAANSAGAGPNTTAFDIGAQFNNLNQFSGSYFGYYGGILVYGRALTDAQVLSNTTAFRTALGPNWA